MEDVIMVDELMVLSQ